jgi:hypothetical protein
MMPISSIYLHSLLEVLIEVWTFIPHGPDGVLTWTSAYQVTNFSD